MKSTEELVPDGAEIVAEIRVVLYTDTDGTQRFGVYHWPNTMPLLDALGMLTYAGHIAAVES